MRIVIDANRAISAILRDGPTRRALIDTSSELYAPTLLREEMVRHRAEIAERARLTTADFDGLAVLLLADVRWVTRLEFASCVEEAERAIGAWDPNDVAYLAAALAIGADAIWSEDAHFDRQSLVPRTRHPDRVAL